MLRYWETVAVSWRYPWFLWRLLLRNVSVNPGTFSPPSADVLWALQCFAFLNFSKLEWWDFIKTYESGLLAVFLAIWLKWSLFDKRWLECILDDQKQWAKSKSLAAALHTAFQEGKTFKIGDLGFPVCRYSSLMHSADTISQVSQS